MPAEPPTAYHRKLAEKLWDIGLLREVATIADASLLMIRVADVLAAKGVVDPDQLLCHAEDLIADWQAGNIQTKDMAVRLHLFVETVTALRAGDIK